MAGTQSTKSDVLNELHKFVEEKITAETPYDQIPKIMAEGGWLWRLLQKRAMPIDVQQYAEKLQMIITQSQMLVDFDFMIGRDLNNMVLVDTVSTTIPATISAVSFYARLSLNQTLVFIATGRLPPAPTAAPQGAAVQHAIEDEDFVLPTAAAPQAENTGPSFQIFYGVDDATGVPLVADLFDIVDFAPEEIIAALLSDLENTMPKIDTPAKLQAFWDKNTEEFAFVSDYGTAADKAALRQIFATRQKQLEAHAPRPANQPRRRAASAA